MVLDVVVDQVARNLIDLESLLVPLGLKEAVPLGLKLIRIS